MRPAGRPPVNVGLPGAELLGQACGPGFAVLSVVLIWYPWFVLAEIGRSSPVAFRFNAELPAVAEGAIGGVDWIKSE